MKEIKVKDIKNAREIKEEKSILKVTNDNIFYIIDEKYNDMLNEATISVEKEVAPKIFEIRNKIDSNLLKPIDVSELDTSEVTDMSHMFSKNIGEYYVKRINGLENLNTSNVTSMGAMFAKCWNLEELDLSNFNTSKVENMSWMFNECEKITYIDLSSFNFSNVKEIYGMFSGCYNLEEIKGIEKLFNCKAYKKLPEEERMNVFKDTKIDVEKELKKINKKEKER